MTVSVEVSPVVEDPHPGKPRHWPGLRLGTVVLVVVVLAVAIAVVTVVAFVVGGGRPRPTLSAPVASSRGAPVVDHPPPDNRPSSPGVVVPSGENESDPYLAVFDGRYFLYTSGVPGLPTVNVPVASADGFDRWSPVVDALPHLPGWAVPGYTWAPTVNRFGAHYVLYFTAMVRGTSPAMECIGDAVGTAPEGPFAARRTPFICQPALGGSIDPRVFTDNRHRSWMLWKSDQNIGGSTRPTEMWSQRLTGGGLGLTGRPSLLMAPDEPWQGTIVEAPDMVEVDGRYWVFYSGNWFNQPAYAIGAAACRGPQGPCADSSDVPLLASNAQGPGPGEASVFADRNGVWLLYSPWRALVAPPVYPPRPVDITRLGFSPAGPYLAAGGPPPLLDPFVASALPFP